MARNWKDGNVRILERWLIQKAVDNQGMAVGGKYTLLENGNVRFEIAHQGSPSEIVIGKLSVREDELTISFKHGNEVERYRRVK